MQQTFVVGSGVLREGAVLQISCRLGGFAVFPCCMMLFH